MIAGTVTGGRASLYQTPAQKYATFGTGTGKHSR
jgi:hypothetical protein